MARRAERRHGWRRDQRRPRAGGGGRRRRHHLHDDRGCGRRRGRPPPAQGRHGGGAPAGARRHRRAHEAHRAAEHRHRRRVDPGGGPPGHCGVLPALARRPAPRREHRRRRSQQHAPRARSVHRRPPASPGARAEEAGASLDSKRTHHLHGEGRFLCGGSVSQCPISCRDRRRNGPRLLCLEQLWSLGSRRACSALRMLPRAPTGRSRCVNQQRQTGQPISAVRFCPCGIVSRGSLPGLPRRSSCLWRAEQLGWPPGPCTRSPGRITWRLSRPSRSAARGFRCGHT